MNGLSLDVQIAALEAAAGVISALTKLEKIPDKQNLQNIILVLTDMAEGYKQLRMMLPKIEELEAMVEGSKETRQ